MSRGLGDVYKRQAVNGEKFTDPKGLVDLSEPVVIKKGKKIFHKAIAE